MVNSLYDRIVELGVRSMTLRGIIAYILAFAQMMGVMLGIIPVGYKAVDYGGGEYVKKTVDEYITLIENGDSDYKIVISETASACVRTASTVLRDYLEQISGVCLPIVDDGTADTACEIVLGSTNREAEAGAVFDREALGDEGFTLLVKGKKVFIAGSDVRGTLYGVYAFLEDELGCRWFTPELTVIPKSGTVKIDARLNDTQIPAFEYRHTDWFSSADDIWAVANRVNGAAVPDEMGGYISYAAFCHTMASLVPDSLFAEHPEFFSYRRDEGRRLDPTTVLQHSQRCLSNPDVLAVTIENTRSLLSSRPQSRIMSITQNDNLFYCECDSCNAIAEQYGGQGGLNLWFVNQVASALEEEFPSVIFDTFAYYYTSEPPKNIAAAPNVCVRFCTIECCYCHPIEQCGHQGRVENFTDWPKEKEPKFANNMKQWSGICDKLYVWDYTMNFLHYMQIFPNFHIMAANLQFFKENNVEGVFEEGNSMVTDGEFGKMKAYILAKLMWNPYQSVEQLMTEFMNAYYGEKSAVYIKKYIDFITNKVTQSTHLFIFNWHYENGYFTYAETVIMNYWWRMAKKYAETPEQLINIRRSELSYRFYKNSMFTGEFSILNPVRFRLENERFYHDIAELGITAVSQGKRFDGSEPDFWLRALDW